MANRTSQGTVAATTGIISSGIEVDPISRIEGHLGVKLATNATGFVSEANVHGNLWRGFENFLIGRNANDAITFTQRICGVCPVPHGLTSTYAVDHALGYSEGHITFAYDAVSGYGIPKKAVHIRNLVLGAETLMSSITHFYHLVALDYVQGPALPPWTPFFNDGFYHALLLNPTATELAPRLKQAYSVGIWDAAITQYVKALRIRRLTFEAGALFAGRMPMTSCFVGGGVTNDGTTDLSTRCAKFKSIMQEVGLFVIKEYVPLVLALGALYPNYDNLYNANTLNTAYGPLWSVVGNTPDSGSATPSAINTGWGAGVGNFLSWGAYPNPDTDGLAIKGGVYTSASGMSFQATNKATVKSQFITPTSANSMASNLKESIAYSHYSISSLDTGNINATTKLAYPGAVQRTKPNRANGYSYIKSPRWNGLPCEVGPLARLVVSNLYKVDQSEPLSTALGAYYTDYTKGAGLDPAMVHADLAVALLRDGLAYVSIPSGSLSGTYGSSHTSTGLATSWLPGGWTANTEVHNGVAPVAGPAVATLHAVYSDPNAVIRGPVADWIILLRGGLSVMDRLRGRALESLYLVQNMVGRYAKGAAGQARGATDNGGWSSTSWVDSLDAITDNTIGSTWRDKVPAVSAVGAWGATEAPRGALAHFLSTNAEGKITAYQCVVPTTWNASPRDINGAVARGPMEQAMIGIPYKVATKNIPSQNPTAHPSGITTQGGLEALRVAHTFDPCIACAVH